MNADEIRLLARFLVHLEDNGIQLTYKRNNHVANSFRVFSVFIEMEKAAP